MTAHGWVAVGRLDADTLSEVLEVPARMAVLLLAQHTHCWKRRTVIISSKGVRGYKRGEVRRALEWCVNRGILARAGTEPKTGSAVFLLGKHPMWGQSAQIEPGHPSGHEPATHPATPDNPLDQNWGGLEPTQNNSPATLPNANRPPTRPLYEQINKNNGDGDYRARAREGLPVWLSDSAEGVDAYCKAMAAGFKAARMESDTIRVVVQAQLALLDTPGGMLCRHLMPGNITQGQAEDLEAMMAVVGPSYALECYTKHGCQYKSPSYWAKVALSQWDRDRKAAEASPTGSRLNGNTQAHGRARAEKKTKTWDSFERA